MPAAARADSKYLCATFSSRIELSSGCDDEHSAPSLRHSEESAVENPPCAHVPEPVQRVDDRGEVAAVMGTEEPGDVLEQDPGGAKLICDPGELVEQAGSFPGEAGASPGDGHVLAGEPAAEEINTTGYPCPGFPPPVVNWRA